MIPEEILALVLVGHLQRADGTGERLAVTCLEALAEHGYELVWRGPGDDPRKAAGR